MTQTTTVQSDSDLARIHVRERYLRPAIQRGDHTVSVNVGAVHKALGFTNRVPLVCAALKSKRFLEENGLRIVSQTGPPSGQSTTVTFIYELSPTNTTRASTDEFLALRGIAKEVFRKLGGGENFIRSERSKFHG
ncbi:MAG TPA: hypothetical protein VJN64_16000 [Terriglobales bacterium]|nr:hypothetical protein [Terriglobales bacterium]